MSKARWSIFTVNVSLLRPDLMAPVPVFEERLAGRLKWVADQFREERNRLLEEMRKCRPST